MVETMQTLDVVNMSEIELKALAWDEAKRICLANENLKIIETELKKRNDQKAVSS